MKEIIVNIILAVVIIAILALAITYIVKAKKNGQKCIGCPDSASCSAKADNSTSCCCGCSGCSYADECPSQQDKD